jgi:hypothetical protein
MMGFSSLNPSYGPPLPANTAAKSQSVSSSLVERPGSTGLVTSRDKFSSLVIEGQPQPQTRISRRLKFRDALRFRTNDINKLWRGPKILNGAPACNQVIMWYYTLKPPDAILTTLNAISPAGQKAQAHLWKSDDLGGRDERIGRAGDRT